MSKYWWLGSVSALALSTAMGAGTGVYAADLPLKAAAPREYVASNWTGFYIGGNVGMNLGKTSLDVLAPAPVYTNSNKSQSPIFGGYAGYNLQNGKFVWGVEGDYSYVSANGPLVDNAGSSIANGRITGIASIRGRLGVDVNGFLPYITAGYAYKWGTFSGMGGTTGTPVFTSLSLNKGGAVVGGGIDYKITPKLSVGVEGLYYMTSSSGSITQTSGGKKNTVKQSYTFTDGNSAMVRARIALHF